MQTAFEAAARTQPPCPYCVITTGVSQRALLLPATLLWPVNLLFLSTPRCNFSKMPVRTSITVRITPLSCRLKHLLGWKQYLSHPRGIPSHLN